MLSPSFQPIWHCTAEVDVIDGGVAAICVQVDAADRLGLEITDKIFVQESSDFGVVVTASPARPRQRLPAVRRRVPVRPLQVLSEGIL